MTGAELKTTREALNLSVVWCSHHFKNKDNNAISERTWRFWESGGGIIPNEIEKGIMQLSFLMNKAIDQGIEQAVILSQDKNINEFVLYRYKTDEDLWQNHSDKTFINLRLPASYHAKIIYLIKLALEDLGYIVKIDYKNS